MKEIIKTRRDFIKQSTMAAGALTFMSACGKSFKSSFDPDAITKFGKSFSGHIIRPGSPEYETARKVLSVNPENDKYPAMIAQCNSEEDVLRSIDFAYRHELEVAVRSGNHSFLGWGTCERGIVIDLSKMKGITIDPEKQTAQVATGNTAEEILSATAQYGLAPVLGQCGSVGAGLSLGGGLGWLSGKYGAACDNLISARLITADAHTLKTDKYTNKDLFWGLRGGGGNFGIVSSFEYQLHPVGEVLAGSFFYPIDKAPTIIRYFREFMSIAPDELQADCSIATHGKGSVKIDLVYTGDLNEGEKLLNRFRKLSPPEEDTVKRRAFSEIYNMHGGERSVPLPFQSVKGSYIEQISDEVIDFVLDCFAHPPPSSALFFNFSHYMHGQVCRVAPDATAFNLRQPSAAHLVFVVQWKDQGNALECLSWHNKTFDLLQQYSGGRTYSNYMSSREQHAVKSIYDTSFARLVELKKKYDPRNFFHLNQNIPPKL